MGYGSSGDDVIDLLQKRLLLACGAAERFAVYGGENAQGAVKIPALDERAFAGAAVGKIGRAKVEAQVPDEVAVFRPVGAAAAWRQQIDERAAVLLLCKKVDELRAAFILCGKLKRSELRIGGTAVITGNGFALCDIHLADLLQRHRTRVDQSCEDENSQNAEENNVSSFHKNDLLIVTECQKRACHRPAAKIPSDGSWCRA